MQRRSFIKNTALSAVDIGISVFVRFDGSKYIGDCETTTDILGPYYRPNSPARNVLTVEGDKGQPALLKGTIRHSDCKTPYKKAKIELWYCSPAGKYDNGSNAFNYRATSYTDENGNYRFKTILPVFFILNCCPRAR